MQALFFAMGELVISCKKNRKPGIYRVLTVLLSLSLSSRWKTTRRLSISMNNVVERMDLKYLNLDRRHDEAILGHSKSIKRTFSIKFTSKLKCDDSHSFDVFILDLLIFVGLNLMQNARSKSFPASSSVLWQTWDYP